jgi:DnaK suppressor protein
MLEGQVVKTEEYKQILLVKEKQLLHQMKLKGKDARELADEQVHDWGDESVGDAEREEQFGVADMEWSTLRQVQAALKRIDAGTFGKCVVDHLPISERRLKEVPWTRFCLKCQQEQEVTRGTRTPTL